MAPASPHSLKFLAAGMQPDSGELAIRKGMHLSLVRQVSDYAEDETIRSVLNRALDEAHVPEEDRLARLAAILGRAGFTDLDVSASSLSGGLAKAPSHCGVARAQSACAPSR